MMEWENKLYQILLKEQEAEAVVDTMESVSGLWWPMT